MHEDVHRRIARDSKGAAWLWTVTRENADYHVCVWRLESEDVVIVEDWERQSSLRRAHGLSELPVPDDRLAHPVPTLLTVQDLNAARALLSRNNEPALSWRVDEFFHAIDRHQHSAGTGVRRSLDTEGSG